jgi:hypothetical protein
MELTLQVNKAEVVVAVELQAEIHVALIPMPELAALE